MSGEKPWIAGDLRIPAAVMAEIEAHALEAYPSEACGFVMGPAETPNLLDEARREENEADKYHKLDPETFPRTSAMYFKINELRAQRTFDAGEAAGRPLKVIYHSHCDAGAYFSAEDAATFASNGQLMWPCAYIVVSVQQGAVAERRLHVHVPGTNDFVESPLTIF
ncbi:MAG: Mov34/MPN/PAD-1 family protein [Polyangiales bacterium]|nr:Mov34/MPN/PAD-1 family protein [Myxococcales bacterium]MCB9659005.1 Mov34/MPN/PAD-1 family protein [Sandaracinaceae bacterium]